jgi:hypothetical protein
MKNAAITSNIDGPCAIDELTKRPTFCTVKEIPLGEMNFRPHDDFEQHCTPSPERSPPIWGVPAFPTSHRFGCDARWPAGRAGLRAKGAKA